MLCICVIRILKTFNYSNFYKELVSNAMPYCGLLPYATHRPSSTRPPYPRGEYPRKCDQCTKHGT
ncbi:hypothetical protein ALT785_60130 [Alteromonas infernus]